MNILVDKSKTGGVSPVCLAAKALSCAIIGLGVNVEKTFNGKNK
jgi:hypothetical protein